MEFRSLPDRAVEPDATPMHLDDLTGDGQSKAGGAGPIRPLARGARLALIADKKPIVEVKRHSPPSIFYHHLDVARIQLARYDNFASSRRVLDRVPQQDRLDLRNLVGVARHRRH